jgi:hypothetical protein
MTDLIPVKIEDTNIEVLAKIVKAASRKYDCSMDIDFQDGNRKAEFIGDEIFKPFIAEEIESIFAKKEKF